jgi:hypothetical protein
MAGAPASWFPPGVFESLPAPTGKPPYRLDLAGVIGAASIAKLEASGSVSFHSIGDSGGVKDPQPQQSVAAALEADLAAFPAAFLYHLGDVVYFNGEDSQYYGQFYEPYQHYNLPIFAVPGNHDGDPLAGTASLAAFVENFCAAAPALTKEAGDSNRDAMTQPNVYWTLTTPFATVVGLYSNVPEGGVVKDDQAAWFVGELGAAARNVPLIAAVHHPLFSLDAHHGSSPAMQTLMTNSFAAAGRLPDLILTGHVHDYQRFTWTVGGRSVPVIVSGAGGYHNLHPMVPGLNPPSPTPNPDVRLEAYHDESFGFLRLSCSAAGIAGAYVAVSAAETQQVDTFTLPLQPG